MKPFVLKVDRINPTCGCADKAWYVLYARKVNGEEVMGADEFTYKNEQEFNTKLDALKVRYNADAEIKP